MKNLMWYQNPANTGDDLLFIDGELITPPSNPLYRNNVRFLMNGVKSNKNKELESTTLYKSDKGYILKDNFEDKDVIGRYVSFVFYSETKNIDDFVRQIQSTCDSIGVEYNVNKYETIKKLATKGKIKKSVIIILVIAVILVLILNSIMR